MRQTFCLCFASTRGCLLFSDATDKQGVTYTGEPYLAWHREHVSVVNMPVLREVALCLSGGGASSVWPLSVSRRRSL